MGDGGDDRSQGLRRELEESRQRLAETQELAQVGSWQWELGDLRSTWSKELLRIFGRDPGGPPPEIGELVGAVHPADRREFEKLVARVRSTPGRFEHRYRILGAGGETRYLQARGRTVADERGTPVRAFGTTQDITDLKRTEHDLRLRVEQQAGVAALGRFALSGADPQALMDEAVQMVSSVLHVDLVEILELGRAEDVFTISSGIGWEPGTVGEVVPADCPHMAHALREGVSLVLDYESEGNLPQEGLLRRHGGRSGIAAAIEGADCAYGTIGAHSTEIRRFSLDDAHFVQAVGHVLGAAIERERSAQVKARLEQAQRLEAVGQLAGGVAHDFNNLLLVILSHTECLIADSRGDVDPSSLHEIERAATSAADLTRQLLLFSRREQRERGGVDLIAAIRDTEALLRRTIGEHIELSVDAPMELPAVNLGSGELDQILVNLAVNARDALPQGGTVAVTVKALESGSPEAVRVPGLKSDRSHVVLAVSDDGEGMSKEVVAQAFDPFFTTKPRGQGTGLGLATVYGIANQVGGQVEIESEPQDGTTVKVYLPVAESLSAPGLERAPAEAPAGDGKTILVVDNEEAVRTIVCHVLERNGYRTRSAAGGAAAEEILDASNGDVDLLLTDVLMPTMSGRELVERVRTERPDLKVVYMSGYSGDATSPLGPWDDGVALLEKPFTGAQLIRAVHEKLS